MSHLNTALQHIRRSPYQAIYAILVMTLTFFITTVFVIVAYGSGIVLNWFETRPQITTFFKDGVAMDKITALEDQLKQTGKIQQIKYISKEEALSIYKDWTKGEPLLQEMVTANLLPASLEISTNNINMLQEVSEVLKKDPSVDEVIFPADIVSSLTSFTSALRKVGLVLISFVGLVSLLEILIIIGMKIAFKKEEIEILRLIGASSWYVRLPFIIEGIIYAVGGAVFGWLLSYILVLYSTPFFVTYLTDIPLFPISPVVMFSILGIMMLIGLVIGIFGSLLAVKRYLR
ncbi:hypothetical protein COY13_00175 [Candidatus Roizmanbacteria bacterium CG_4_10_14_0_2_um_filter_36_35]|uniref:Cell division protein FtsX n=2 Tax=Microgenomates group TaxID=1794810 RepID=A0A2M7UCQ2_9BACT|nr:MAG: hypothetical protein COT44_01270 [Candidatus Shapirobacteria bacterium CG08_land_8_20_14_0_20_39_18]PIY66272.1 MAG: hypothetical protein COY91_00865 [Candidatus Shapirobacteria bacterium CG_4_10_14_0_8_um_filter_39_15]PIZ68939.1 MAG: hypothetical protein COY13_00175 [Candidatus Roizmanbacteria bacterium CG_4_10_14_0_2_um_filter_36_35]